MDQRRPLPAVQGACNRQGEDACGKDAAVYAHHGSWRPYCLQHADTESNRVGSTRYARAVGGASDPLPGLRLGILGSPYHEPLRPHEPPAGRVAKFMDYLQHHLLHAHGTPVPTFTTAEADALRAITAALDIEMHAVWRSHPFEAHPVIAARRLGRASQAILQAHHRIASQAGMETYTIQPPRVDSMPLDAFAAEVGSLRDHAREAGLATRLHVANGAPVLHGAPRHLAAAGELVDFARENSVTPTIHAGHIYATTNPTRHTGHALDENSWRDLLRSADAGVLVVYASSEYDHDGSWIGAGSYTCEEEAAPGVRPLLRALLEDGAPRTLLVEGPMPEADALSVMHEASELLDVDPAPILEARGYAYSDHSHEMRFAVPVE